jgi:cardiolipin synthase (CMP-forming)
MRGAVTLANQITCARLALVPVFVALGIVYGRSVDAGAPDQFYQVATVTLFTLIGVCDGLDGYIARHWNQMSKLGAILDPLADKVQMLAALLMLSLSSWPDGLPLWLPGVVIARDVLSSLAAWLIYGVQGAVNVRPHWTGKLATVLNINAIGWSMLGLTLLSVRTVAAAAAVVTVLSGGVYLVEGIRQLFAPPKTA